LTKNWLFEWYVVQERYLRRAVRRVMCTIRTHFSLFYINDLYQHKPAETKVIPMVNKTVVIVIAAVLLIAGVAGLAFVSLNQPEEKSDVRVGYLVGDLHQLARVIADNKTAFNNVSLFETYGLNVSYPTGPLANGGAVMDALAANLIDVGYLGAPPAILKHLNSNNQIVIIAQVNNEGSSIIVKSGINTIQDLDQKTVATPGTSSIQHLLLLQYASENGMNVTQAGASSTPNTIYWTAIAPVLQKAALQDGLVDGAVGWEPYGSDSILAGTAHVLKWSDEIWADHPCCVIAANRTFAATHESTIAKLLKAHVEANKWINTTTHDVGSSNYSKLLSMAEGFSLRNESVVVNSLAHIVYTYDITSHFREGLKMFTQALIDQGLVATGKLSDRGYSSLDDFVARFADTKYLNLTASVTPVS
jgi:NitT/TauT family transport system substrate-binding protein